MTDRLPTSFRDLMDLEEIASGFFVGRSPNYEWGRVYGGQVVAQALRAAAATVDPTHRVHSLHAYFVLGGVPAKPILYEVDRLRDGKSFTTRRVVARQAGGAILNLDASFQKVEDDMDVQEVVLGDDVPRPDDLPNDDWSAFGNVRPLPRVAGDVRSRLWMRINQELGDDPVLHACGLAYLSDHNPIDAMILAHPKGYAWNEMMTASLDHAIWFHRTPRADDWILFDTRGHGLGGARGMATGAALGIDGRHLATIAQEGLVRSPRTKG